MTEYYDECLRVTGPVEISVITDLIEMLRLIFFLFMIQGLVLIFVLHLKIPPSLTSKICVL